MLASPFLGAVHECVPCSLGLAVPSTWRLCSLGHWHEDSTEVLDELWGSCTLESQELGAPFSPQLWVQASVSEATVSPRDWAMASL